MFELGRLLLEESTAASQTAEAEAWLLKAVAVGCVQACVAVGQLYYNGDVGLDEQPGKAEEYWMQASDQGNAEAQNLLGCYYFFEKVTNRERMQLQQQQ
jgi:TPR repeat protein